MATTNSTNGSKEGLSLQMALLHLRWQQIRQLELQEATFNEEEEGTLAVLSTNYRADEAYTTV